MRPRLARRGERRNVFFRVAELVQLQCGPGSLAGENESQLHRRNPATRASMRPRLARRGEPNDATTVVATTRSFNAAPARTPGRTSTRVKARRDVDMLQCGPGSLAGENPTLTGGSQQSGFTKLQCGPGSLAGENSAGLRALSSRFLCFNAAPARSPGRTSTRIPRISRSEKLQCGPGSLAGENRERWPDDGIRTHSFNAAPARSPGRT